ncbi:MarR family transcriptional regulator [Fulvivirgaceae bacterium BMA10]|uniref:MarR family transcriptional regulator n=1 Tax=Splendidivirga corallicola TaxID=3051826 RepID=A0ABT8KT75_9BACT|nr:MarR family transcriptional regulator [Fulvivirgaceae bacterium BMA10]
MSLEKDIVQSKFSSEEQKAFINIIYTHNFLINNLNSIFKSHKITRQQYNVLRILRGQHPKPASINLIKERMLDKMSDASRIVDRLKAKELVTSVPCKHDRRATDVNISKKGLQLLEQTDGDVEIATNLLRKLSRSELESLNTLLDKVRA